MAKRSAARRAEAEDTGRPDPSRPDVIPSQTDDEVGGVVDIGIKPGVVDVNTEARQEDARSDAEKDQERQRQQDEAGRGEQEADQVDETEARRSRTDDDDDAAVRRQRRENRERDAQRRSDERVSNLTAENRKLKEQMAKLERGGDQKTIEATIGQMRAQIESLKKDLFTLTEGGKTAEALDVQIKMGEIQARLALAERDLEVAKRQPEPVAAEVDTDRGAPERPKLVDDWMRANRKWWGLPSAEALVRAARAIDIDILADIDDGELDYEKYSEDHLDEMTKRVAAEAKRLGLDFDIKDFQGEVFAEEEQREEPAATGRERGSRVTTERRPAAGGMGGRQGNRKPPSDLELAKQGKARLTEEDYATMRIFKIDPNDEKARKHFAKERVRLILTDAKKSGGGR